MEKTRGEANFDRSAAVENRSDATADNVSRPQPVERTHEQEGEFRFGHWRKSASLPAKPVLPTNRHVGCAAKRPSFHAPSSKALRPAQGDVLGSCAGKWPTVRDSVAHPQA